MREHSHRSHERKIREVLPIHAASQRIEEHQRRKPAEQQAEREKRSLQHEKPARQAHRYIRARQQHPRTDSVHRQQQPLVRALRREQIPHTEMPQDDHEMLVAQPVVETHRPPRAVRRLVGRRIDPDPHRDPHRTPHQARENQHRQPAIEFPTRIRRRIHPARSSRPGV